MSAFIAPVVDGVGDRKYLHIITSAFGALHKNTLFPFFHPFQTGFGIQSPLINPSLYEMKGFLKVIKSPLIPFDKEGEVSLDVGFRWNKTIKLKGSSIAKPSACRRARHSLYPIRSGVYRAYLESFYRSCDSTPGEDAS